MRELRFALTNGTVVGMTAKDTDDLSAIYKAMALDRMFILTDLDGKFKTALNPKHIVEISVCEG